MKIVIIAMDDPLYTNRFIKQIINARKDDIVKFVYVSKGNRMTISKGKSKYEYLLSLLMIMGLVHFIKNSAITVLHKLKIKLSKYFIFIENPLVISFAKKMKIDTIEIQNPNSKEFLEELTILEPDIIINQSQSIIKEELLQIPKIGVINRHNALLPKNRGRLTPFWVLYKQEKETGVSIHFVEKELDSGSIIVQKRFPITQKDTFNSVVKKNYDIAGDAMLEAIDKLERGLSEFISNDNEMATYNTTPSFKQAWEYRKIVGFR